MDDKQREAFDQWFDSELDPELNLTPGDKELCRHAWQAALSHAEGEAVAEVRSTDDAPLGVLAFLPGRCDLPVGTKLYTSTAPQVAVPEKYQQAAERYITQACRNAVEKLNELAPHMQWDSGDSTAEIYIRRLRAIAATAATAAPAPTKGEEIHVNVDGGSVYTLPLEPTGMAAPRFVVHVPAPTASAGEPEFHIKHKILRDALCNCGIAAPLSNEELGLNAASYAKSVVRAVARAFPAAPDEREIAALREDAERYHFLISIFGADDDDLYNAIDGAMPAEVRTGKRQPTKAEMDIALDAARLRAGNGEPK